MDRYVGGKKISQENTSSPRDNNTSILKVESIAQILKKILYLYMDNWMWFLLSFAIAFGIAFFMIKSTAPVYERTISILIRSKQDTDEKWMKGLGIDPVYTNMSNEMQLLKTAKIAQEIVHRLNLNIEYIMPGKFYDKVLYGDDSPVKVEFPDLLEEENASFKLSLSKDGTVKLTGFNSGKEDMKKVIKGKLNDTISTPIGKIFITPTQGKIKPIENLIVRHSNVNGVANVVRGRITPTRRTKDGSIIDIYYRDVSKTRAEDVLNTLIGVYNENWLKDRNLKTVNTDKFIKERLSLIEDELSDMELSISEWKSQNLILDVHSSGSLAQTQATEAERSLQDLSNQTYMTKYIRDYLTDGKHENQLLPANSGITNSSIESLIAEYNDLMLKRNNHLAATSVHNPLVIDLDENLNALKGSILQSLDYELIMLQSKERQLRGQKGEAVSRIAVNPQKSRQLLSAERQQKVKEHLYLYLLERREENELSQAFDVYNNQFIEPPFGSPGPVAPVPRTTYTIAFAIALVIPTLILGTREFFNTRVTGKNDLEGLSVPYAGDIPLDSSNSQKNIFKKQNKEKTPPTILVQGKKRDIINEAFRVVRTNLEFMLGFKTSHQVIMITSLTPGSGKTFITANLAEVFAIRDKKVLAIDLDLRKRTLSHYVDNPKLGISNYLSGQVSDYKDLIIKLDDYSILPCGKLPPNPAELLYSPAFKEMLDELKQEYDYIFLDCPPVEIVAETTLISQYADLTLFIIRARNLYKDMLPDIESWYQDKKYGNLAVILNGIERTRGKYGYHRYGYHYGSTGYGYGGYGYGRNKSDK